MVNQSNVDQMKEESVLLFLWNPFNQQHTGILHLNRTVARKDTVGFPPSFVERPKQYPSKLTVLQLSIFHSGQAWLSVLPSPN